MVLRRLDQSNSIFGKARTAVAWASVKKFGSNPVVKPYPARDFLHVSANFLCKIGDLIDERDLRGEKRVGGVFDQFGRATAGKQDRRTVEIKRLVQLAHYLSGSRIRAADHDPIGMLEILDGGALAEEFGVGHDGAVGIGPSFADDTLDLVTGSDGNG